VIVAPGLSASVHFALPDGFDAGRGVELVCRVVLACADDEVGSRAMGFCVDDEDDGPCADIDLWMPLAKFDLASCSWRLLMKRKVES